MSTDNPVPLSSSLIKKIINKIKKNSIASGKNTFDAEIYDQLDTPRKDMINGIIMLSELNAKDIMIPRVDLVAIDVEADLKSLVKTIIQAAHSRIPVYEGTIDNIIGILHVKDLIKLIPLSGKMKKFNMRKLVHEPLFVPETMSIDELLLEFKTKKLHLAVAVDEYGGLAGIVSIEDILEVIVGEIQDEFDTEEIPEFEKMGPNLYDVDSRMLISDFNEQLKVEIPTDNFDTIGGFVFDLFGRVPKRDETIKYESISFKIKELSGIKIVRITAAISKHK